VLWPAGLGRAGEADSAIDIRAETFTVLVPYEAASRPGGTVTRVSCALQRKDGRPGSAPPLADREGDSVVVPTGDRISLAVGALASFFHRWPRGRPTLLRPATDSAGTTVLDAPERSVGPPAKARGRLGLLLFLLLLASACRQVSA